MASKKIVVTIKAATSEFNKAMLRIRRDLNQVDAASSAAIRGSAATLVALGIPAAVAVKNFQDFKLGLAGVNKVAELSDEELKQFETNIRNISKTTPLATDALLENAEAAAVLGIRGSENLSQFAETMGRLGVATNVQGGEAAKQIARIIGLSNEAPASIDRFGSSLVELGNNFKASEDEILQMATRVKQSTAAFDLSSDQVLAIAAAAVESGQEQKQGGLS